MAVITEGIRANDESGLCFGDYSVKAKLKVDGFEFGGDLYKVKTHDEVTRLEKNGTLLLETVPGAAIHNFTINEKTVAFAAEGQEDTQITLELEPETEYTIFLSGVNTGKMKTNVSGKVIFSAELTSAPSEIKIKKVI
ncbi:MAG: endosialidase [Clostridiales bacterium]|jgi:hypothetical protein|nr:endosialidase [Clostridiales bacterium]